jgi:hypothetical protein
MVREVPNYAQQYLTEHPELNPPQPAPAKPTELPAAESKKTAAEPSHSSDCSAATAIKPAANDAAATTTKPAAERRQNAAHGASRGNQAETHQAPEERKRSCDPHVQSEPSPVAGYNSHPSPKEKLCAENTLPLTNRQANLGNEIKKLEASIEGAMRGNWRDLRTVFNAVGLTSPGRPATNARKR